MKQFGLIGYPLSHSFSKGYFTEKFLKENISYCSYDVFPLEKIEEFVELCNTHNNLCGLNVTIPYKEKIIPYLDGLHEEALAIGAVNTIKFINGKKIGYNTDCYGFEQSLKPLLKTQHTSALILGTGGASKAIEYVLKKLKIKFQYVSRKKTNNAITYDEINNDMVKESLLIINCSPIGMYPFVDAVPEIPFDAVSDQHLLYDLIYNPEETLFLKEGKIRGARTKNGLDMLYLQAEKSWEIWQSR